jgi:DNA-binding response OmpR family regulator
MWGLLVLKLGWMRPRIVIVDDDPSFLATVRLLLEAEGFAVVGEALTGLAGVAAATRLDPDIVLVDVNLPDIDGFEVVERLADQEGAPPVVLTSIRSAGDFGNLVETSRALGFITKADITGEVLAGFLDGRAAST